MPTLGCAPASTASQDRKLTVQHRITAATALDGYRVDLVFDGNVAATVDLAPFFAEGEVTEPFHRNPEIFASGLAISGDDDWLAWPHDVEIDADALWYKAFPDDLRHDHGVEVVDQHGRAATNPASP
jgi:hypothetical protein